jgi:hypothetical protein
LNHANFKEVVEEFWRSYHCEGWMGFILKEKLKGLKEFLKGWNKEVYGELDTKILMLVENIKLKDLLWEERGLSAADVEVRK